MQQQQQNGYPINNEGTGGDHPTPLASQAPNTTEGDASYFPQVTSTQPREREETERQRELETASEPPQQVEDDRPRLIGHSASDTLAVDLAQRLRLEEQGAGVGGDIRNGTGQTHHRRNSSVIVVGGVTAQPGWAEEEVEVDDNEFAVQSEGPSTPEEEAARNLKQERRKSFVPPSASNEEPTTSSSIVSGGGLSGGSPGKLRVGESAGIRRASFEDSTRTRPAFGTSIWG